MKKPELARRVARWMLLSYKLDLTIINIPGKYHVVTDYWTRLENGEDGVVINDNFEHLDAYNLELEL